MYVRKFPVWYVPTKNKKQPRHSRRPNQAPHQAVFSPKSTSQLFFCRDFGTRFQDISIFFAQSIPAPLEVCKIMYIATYSLYGPVFPAAWG